MESRARQSITRFLLALLFACGGTFAAHRSATAKEDLLKINQAFPGPEDLQYLPRYCWARMQVMGKRDVSDYDPVVYAEVQEWRAMLGEGIFVHLHHYCGGLDRMRRYWLSVDMDGRQLDDIGRVTGGQRMTLEAALDEFRYVQGYMKNLKSILYPDMMVQKAIAHWQLGEIEKAIKDLLTATNAKRDFDAPYLILSQIAEEQGNLKDAVDILELGIKQVPGAASLRSRLDKLRGR